VFGQTLQSVQQCLARHCSLYSSVWPDTAICAAVFDQTLQSVQQCLVRHCNLCRSVWPDTAICTAVFGQTLQSGRQCLARHCSLCSHLNTLADTIRWQVTSTGRYVNLWGCRVLKKYYGYIPERVISVNSTTTIWDVLVIRD
jgi:hypothetical protein